MGANVFHCGESGAGGAAKLCNNLLLGISMIGVSEAYALGEKLGECAASERVKVSVDQ
jgi:3-hydroxyisobutyrate dehydrogenase